MLSLILDLDEGWLETADRSPSVLLDLVGHPVAR